jgi:hypothetical protein
MKLDAEEIEGMIESIPKEIQVLQGTLAEMKKSSEPNREADYWDEKTKIRKNIDDLSAVETNLESLTKKFKARKEEGHRVSNDTVAAGMDSKALKAEVLKLEKVVEDIQSMILEFNEQKFIIVEV